MKVPTILCFDSVNESEHGRKKRIIHARGDSLLTRDSSQNLDAISTQIIKMPRRIPSAASSKQENERRPRRQSRGDRM